MLSEGPVFFYHGRTSDGYRFTIAGRYQLLNEDPVRGIPVIMMGLSLCSKCENFAKKLGRIRAEGRMKSNSSKGRSFYSLRDTAKSPDWFEDQKMTVFVEAARMNETLSRRTLMLKFDLK